MKQQSLHNTILYPDETFPYIVYNVSAHETIPEGRGFNDLHWHEELQISLVTNGKLIMQVNGIDHELETGQAILINKGVLHIATQITPNGQYVSFAFPEKHLALYANNAMEKKYVYPYTNSYLLSYVINGGIQWQDEILELLWEMKQKYDIKKWGWEYEISIKTAQLWFIFISNISLTSEEVPKYNKLQQERLQLMLSFIHKNYVDNITLKEIADVAHLSVSECSRSFKKTIHITPYDYLIKYRIKKGSELLLSTGYSVTEISQRVGFNHVNNFIQSFRKQYKITPKEFRKLNNE